MKRLVIPPMIPVLFLTSFLCFVTSGEAVYRFYQSMQYHHGPKRPEDGRRADYGPPAAALSDFPYICLLSDKYWVGQCACSVIAPRWVLTAAHCIDGTGKYQLYYITYNSELPYEKGDYADILRTFHHPKFGLSQEHTTQGVGVAKLRNDVGLARSGREMVIKHHLPQRSPLQLRADMTLDQLNNREVKVFGFTRTRTKDNRLSLELFVSRVKLQSCGRNRWSSCMCGGMRDGGNPAEICWGDSGGPVVFDGIQIGIVSMGPIECATRSEPSENATSVITVLPDYMRIINATIRGIRGMDKMQADPFHQSTSAGNVLACNVSSFVAFVLTLSFNVYNF